MDDKNYPFGVPADGVEQFLISQKEAKKIGLTTLVSDVPLQEYSSGALADGTFLLTGPVSKKGSADTYILNQDLTLKEYGKRVWSYHILNPASAAYKNAFYFLAKTAPSGTGLPSLVFSSTAVNAGIPAGDALIRPIVSKPARTGSGVPDFKNTDISVTWNDLVNNLKDQAQKAIDRINQVSEDSEVYLEVNRLAENDVQPAEKEAILNAASQDKMTENLFLMYIAMQLRIPGHEKLKLDENLTGTKATVKLPGFPEIQKGMTRSYQIFAYNPYGEDGKKAEVITPEFDTENQTLSFNLKNSSVYAIGYLDSKDPSPEPAPDPKPALTLSNSTSPANPSNSAMPSSSSSRTAAQTNTVLWGGLAAGAFILAVTVTALKKKK